jgi:hypothetical protein
VSPDRVPAAALAGVPALPAALAAALGTAGTLTLSRAAGPAREAARAVSPERSRAIEAIARHGAAALSQDDIAGELIAAAGRAVGGTLTRDDLLAVRPAVVPCDAPGLVSGVLTVPWTEQGSPLGGDPRAEGQPEGPARTHDASSTHVVAALDARGVAALACYESPLEGLPVPALALLVPACAAPVMRGQPRVRPGEPRAAAAPLAVIARRGVIDAALGVALVPDAEQVLATVLSQLEHSPLAAAVAIPRGCAIAVARTRSGSALFGSPSAGPLRRGAP